MTRNVGLLLLLLGVFAVPTSSARAQVPGANGRIIYSQANDGRLIIVDADGTDPQPLDLFGVFPEWSPSRNEIVYWTSNSTVLYDLGSGQSRALVAGMSPSNAASWSPSGDQLAVVVAGSVLLLCVHQGTHCMTDQTVHQPAGECGRINQRFPDAGTLCASGPIAWSPGGTTIAWVSVNSFGHYQLQLMQPDGSNLRSIHTSPPGSSDPSVSMSALNWHPSGEFLSFQTAVYTSGPTEVESSIAVDGTFVTPTPGLRGRWAPNGIASVYTNYVTDEVSGFTTWVSDGTTSFPLPKGGPGSAGVGASWERLPATSPTCVANVAPGMIGWWTGSSDGSAVIGPGLVGTPTVQAGLSGSAFSFDGTTQLETTNLEVPTSAVTVEAWVKPEVEDGLVRTVMSRWDFPSTDDSARAYTLQLMPNGTISWITDETSSRRPEELRSPEMLLTDGNFHHIAATWDQHTMSIFVDGVLVASKQSQGGTLNPAPLTPFRLGGEVTGFTFKGIIDEPAIYKRALSSADIEAIFVAGALAKCV